MWENYKSYNLGTYITHLSIDLSTNEETEQDTHTHTQQ